MIVFVLFLLKIVSAFYGVVDVVDINRVDLSATGMRPGVFNTFGIVTVLLGQDLVFSAKAEGIPESFFFVFGYNQTSRSYFHRESLNRTDVDPVRSEGGHSSCKLDENTLVVASVFRANGDQNKTLAMSVLSRADGSSPFALTAAVPLPFVFGDGLDRNDGTGNVFCEGGSLFFSVTSTQVGGGRTGRVLEVEIPSTGPASITNDTLNVLATYDAPSMSSAEVTPTLFGHSLAVYGDLLVIGAPGDFNGYPADVSPTSVGGLFFFDHSLLSTMPLSVRSENEASGLYLRVLNGQFGGDFVRMTAEDGSRLLVVSAWLEQQVGALYLFDLVGADPLVPLQFDVRLKQRSVILEGGAQSERFDDGLGKALGVTPNGKWMVAGRPLDSFGAPQDGSFSAYRLTNDTLDAANYRGYLLPPVPDDTFGLRLREVEMMGAQPFANVGYWSFSFSNDSVGRQRFAATSTASRGIGGGFAVVFEISPCEKIGEYLVDIGSGGNITCAPCDGGYLFRIDQCVPCGEQLLSSENYGPQGEPGTCAICYGEVAPNGISCQDCDVFDSLIWNAFMETCEVCDGTPWSPDGCFEGLYCDLGAGEVLSPATGLCNPCIGLQAQPWLCEPCPTDQVPDPRRNGFCIPAVGGGGGGGDGGGGLSAGAIAGVTVGAAAGVAVVCCCVLLCLVGLCCLLAVLAIACVVAVAVLVVLAALVVVGIGGSAATAVARKKAKKVYDLRAFEGYEGEEVSDGLKREFRELLFGDLTFDKKIGEGAFGRVFLGCWRGTTIVAIKELNVLADERAKVEFVHEANIMARLGNHPYVVHFVGAVTTEERFYMVSEFAQNGSLLDVLKKGKVNLRDDEQTLLRLCAEAAAGVAHLHAEGVVHRDIAARNFLVGRDLTVMVADFGLSRVVEAGEGEEAAAQRTQSNVGPIRWMAPESVCQRQYSKASDVWMFACFLVEMVTADVPFPNLPLEEVITQVTSGVPPDVPPGTPPMLAQVMQGSWLPEPKKRLSMKRIYRMLSGQDGADGDSSPSKTVLNHSTSSATTPQDAYVGFAPEPSGGPQDTYVGFDEVK